MGEKIAVVTVRQQGRFHRVDWGSPKEANRFTVMEAFGLVPTDMPPKAGGAQGIDVGPAAPGPKDSGSAWRRESAGGGEQRPDVRFESRSRGVSRFTILPGPAGEGVIEGFGSDDRDVNGEAESKLLVERRTVSVLASISTGWRGGLEGHVGSVLPGLIWVGSRCDRGRD